MAMVLCFGTADAWKRHEKLLIQIDDIDPRPEQVQRQVKSSSKRTKQRSSASSQRKSSKKKSKKQSSRDVEETNEEVKEINLELEEMLNELLGSMPSGVPSQQPSTTPTVTGQPTLAPTPAPTSAPTASPTKTPTPDPSVSPSETPSTVPTQSPTLTIVCNGGLTLDEREEQLFDMVKVFSDFNLLEDATTNEYRAFRWLVDDDGMRVCPEDTLDVTQRYTMALLYYSTEGDMWNECSALSSPTPGPCADGGLARHLGNVDVCFWFGVSCVLGFNDIDLISIGKS
jgi:hypothetical protein